MPFQPQHEARIARIAGMMRRLEWVRGETGPKLAAELGLHPATIEADAAEASKRVAAELMSAENVKTDVAAALAIGLKGAVDDRDWRALSNLAKVYSDAAGASAPQKHQVGVGTLAELIAHGFSDPADTSAGDDAEPGDGEGVAEPVDERSG